MTPTIERITKAPAALELLNKTNELVDDVNTLSVFCEYVRQTLFTDVTGNPFTVTFESLNGVSVTGTWNEAQKRIEF